MAKKKKQVFLKFYTRDWRADPALRRCEPASRALWIDLLTIMHDEGKPYGHLKLYGVKPSPAALVSMTGMPETDIKTALENLEKNGVFSRKKDGTIYSRRMVRDFAKAEKDRKNGAKGGNPDLFEGVNPPVKVEDKAHIPDSNSTGNRFGKTKNQDLYGIEKGRQRTTIKDPAERLARFQDKLARALGRGGSSIVAAAMDPENPLHARSVKLCKDTATRMNKRWPTQWQTAENV